MEEEEKKKKVVKMRMAKKTKGRKEEQGTVVHVFNPLITALSRVRGRQVSVIPVCQPVLQREFQVSQKL